MAEFMRQRLSRADRQRAVGAGGKFKLSLEGLMVMTLFFLRHYPTYAVRGVLFGLHESNAYRDVQMMQAFMCAYLPLARTGEADEVAFGGAVVGGGAAVRGVDRRDGAGSLSSAR